MKKLLLLLALCFCSLGAWAYSFSATAPSGQILYYNITSSTHPLTVEVTKQQDDSPYYTTYPTENLTIPSSVTYGGDTYLVTNIDNYAFFMCRDLTSVTIPNSVTSIGNYAFDGCIGLTSVTIPNSVTTIGNSAFCGCDLLTRVTIPNSVTSIGTSAFAFSGLTSVTIGDSVTTIGQSAFANSHLVSVTIPNSVTSIGTYAFAQCSDLTYVTIGNSVESIARFAFFDCGELTRVYYTGTIAGWCGISFESYTGNPLYYGHHLYIDNSEVTNLVIPNSVNSIGENAFYGCSELTSVTIPNSVTSIGSHTFSDCSKLKTVYNLSNLSITNSDYGLNANRVVNCTEHSGSGDNIIYKIPTSYTIVNNYASTSSTQIPYSAIPTNFIYHDNGAKDGGGWKAKNIVLTDGQDAFESPETFTAETATYTRVFTNSHRSTLYLPFTAATPSNLEVYEFSGFDGSTLYFSEHTTGVIDAYTPYLVGYGLEKSTTKCVITKTNAVFPATTGATPAYTTTHGGMTFKGTLARTGNLSTNNYGYKDGFFVQSGGAAHVNPFRCYFTYSGDTPSQMPPHTLSVAFGDGPLAIDAVEAPATNGSIRYSNDVYDLMGRLVRKDAATLDGLPTGIYIWKGRKVLAR